MCSVIDRYLRVICFSSGLFPELSIDPQTGVLSVNCTGPGLDRERTDVYQIKVAVHDSGSRLVWSTAFQHSFIFCLKKIEVRLLIILYNLK